MDAAAERRIRTALMVDIWLHLGSMAGGLSPRSDGQDLGAAREVRPPEMGTSEQVRERGRFWWTPVACREPWMTYWCLSIGLLSPSWCSPPGYF